MKTFLIFVIGLIAGAFAFSLYQQRDAAPVTSLADRARDAAGTAATKTRDTAVEMKDAVAEKFSEWHLSSDEIKTDLQRTGQVVRAKAAVAGDKISDARIVTVVKAKFLLDRHLSALDINVDCTAGEVTLHGTVAAHEFIGRAVVLALETDGVRTVVSKLTVEAKTKA